MTYPLPHYSIGDFVTEYVKPYAMKTGKEPTHCVLPVQKYLSLADQVYAGAHTMPPPNLTSLEVRTMVGKIKVVAVDNGIMLGHDDFLRWAREAGYTELQVGIYRYPIQQSRPISTSTPGFPTTIFGSWQQPPDNLTPPQATTAADPEPPCHCDSHKLATVGHDEYCAYILWKRRGGK